MNDESTEASGESVHDAPHEPLAAVQEPAAVTRSENAPPPVPAGFHFAGSGSEYFRIWIVNLALTIITLGVYGAWAKVRRLQYFYRATELAGSGFEYYGQPKAILMGRVVAVLMFGAYQFAASVSVALFAVVIVILLLAGPWLLHNALRFRLHNSSYRGLRFGFAGTIGGAYAASYTRLLLMGALGIGAGLLAQISKAVGGFVLIALMLTVAVWIYPAWYHDFKRYQHNGTRYGSLRFSFAATTAQFSKIFVVSLLLSLLAIVVAGVGAAVVAPESLSMLLSAQEAGTEPDSEALAGALVVVFMIYATLFLAVMPYFRSRIDNLIWNQTRLGDHRFESRLTARHLGWLYFTNLIGVIVTLGFFMPWALVRLARYRAESLRVVLAAPLDDIVAGDSSIANALGEEAASVFDIDIAL